MVHSHGDPRMLNVISLKFAQGVKNNREFPIFVLDQLAEFIQNQQNTFFSFIVGF